MPALKNENILNILEAALLVAGRPLNLSSLTNLFPENERPTNHEIKQLLTELSKRYEKSGIQLKEVASGYRIQAKTELTPYLAKLWEERPPRYSRAFMETLAIIAYKQPITRAEIEAIRGVTVSSQIIKTLMEREWVRIIGFREVPGKPALFGTTKTFLDYFNVKSLTALPNLQEFKNIKTQEAVLQVKLALENSDIGPDNSELIPEEHAVFSDQEATG